MQDRSFTVPQILNFPILPPANFHGDTIKPSVVKAALVPPIGRIAASSLVNSGF